MLAVLGASASLIASPAVAARAPADEARATLRMAADCAAENNNFYRYGVQLRSYMATSPFDPSLADFSVEGWTYGELNHSVKDTKFAWMNAVKNCMYGRRVGDSVQIGKLNFTPLMLRGMMFRGLYRAQFGSSRPIVLLPAQAEPAWRLAEDHGFTPLQQFGECVVQHDPQVSRDVLFAPAGDAEEATAYKRLAPALNDCLSPRTTLRFSKTVIEGVLAEALFHLSGGTLADPRKTRHG